MPTLLRLELLDPDISVPDLFAVVLKSDLSHPGKRAQGELELILFAIGILPGDVPVVQVHVNDLLSIHDDFQEGTLRCDRHAVPLPRRLHHVLAGGETVIDGPTVMRTDSLLAEGVEYLNLNTRLHALLDVPRADEDATIGFLGHLEFQIENEVPVGISSPSNCRSD